MKLIFRYTDADTIHLSDRTDTVWHKAKWFDEGWMIMHYQTVVKGGGRIPHMGAGWRQASPEQVAFLTALKLSGQLEDPGNRVWNPADFHGKWKATF